MHATICEVKRRRKNRSPKTGDVSTEFANVVSSWNKSCSLSFPRASLMIELDDKHCIKSHKTAFTFALKPVRLYFTQLKTTVPTIHSLVPLKRSRSVLIILDLLINLTHYFDYSVKMLITRTLIFFTLLMAKIYESLACLYNPT